jgi:hypothetical protein
MTKTRTGSVQYLAGYRQDAHTPGMSPVYQFARVDEYEDGTVIFYPPTAAARTSDGGITLPPELMDQVRWK